MVSGKHKSGRFRAVKRRTPGSRVSVQYKQGKPKNAKCGECGVILKGVPRGLSAEMKNLPKTKKRPQRPYGGVLCSKCSRAKIKADIKEIKE